MASAGGDWKDFYAAAERGDLACVRYHLSAGVDVNYQHPEVMLSALVISTMQGHEAVVRLLLNHGADANLPAELGDLMPLHLARERGHTAIASLLLAHGAQQRPVTRRPFWSHWLGL